MEKHPKKSQGAHKHSPRTWAAAESPAPPPTHPTQSQTCPPVVTIARGNHKHGTGRYHSWRCPSATSVDDLSNRIFSCLGLQLLVFWRPKYQTDLVFWTSKYQINLVFWTSKYQNAMVCLKVRFWYFRGFAFGTCQTKNLGRFGNEIEKSLVLKNVSRFLLGFSVLVQKTKNQKHVVFKTTAVFGIFATSLLAFSLARLVFCLPKYQKQALQNTKLRCPKYQMLEEQKSKFGWSRKPTRGTWKNQRPWV